MSGSIFFFFFFFLGGGGGGVGRSKCERRFEVFVKMQKKRGEGV